MKPGRQCGSCEGTSHPSRYLYPASCWFPFYCRDNQLRTSWVPIVSPQTRRNMSIAASWLPASMVVQASSTMITWKPRSAASRAVMNTHMSEAIPAITTVSIYMLRRWRSMAVEWKALLVFLSRSSSPGRGLSRAAI